MKITVKPRFNASKQQLERYSETMYLAYLPFAEDSSAAGVIAVLLSRTMGIPPHKIEFVAVDSRKDWIFETV